MTGAVKLIEAPKGVVRLIGHKTEAKADPFAPMKSSNGTWYHRSGGVEKMWLEKTGRRVIEGVASTGRVSSNKQSFNPKGCIARLPVPLLFGHGYKEGTRTYGYRKLESAQVGEVVMLAKSQDEIVVRAIVDDSLAGDAVWELIESGQARCFSVAAVQGTGVMKGLVNGIPFFHEWALKEVSVCFKGANPDCHFDIVSGS